MKFKKEPVFVFIFFLGLLLVNFYPMFKGLVPIPLDLLAGSYYPWLDHKWGFVVGVPVKNPSVTDVVSQLYPWRSLVMDIWRSGQIPLWNPYSFSGTPLLANWQSAPFYPLNILMLIFGNLWGWSLMTVLQPLLSLVFMYLYLRQIRLRVEAALVGSVIFAFSGFMVTYLEYNTGGQIMLWLPLLLYLLEKHISTGKTYFLVFLPPVIFCVLTAGFFQPALYCLAFAFAYFVFRIEKTFKKLLVGCCFFLLGLGLAAVQLIPTGELLLYSFRNLDHNIIEYSYGLLPVANLITFLSPDFFGNPATYNFWGFMGYQETSGYFGIIGLALALIGISKIHTQPIIKFFTAAFFVSLVLAFATPLGQLVYTLKMPLLSTGYASRAFFLTTFLGACLAAIGLHQIISEQERIKRFSISRTSVWLMAVLTGILVGVAVVIAVLNPSAEAFGNLIGQLKMGFRNSLLPLAFLGILLFVTRFTGKRRIWPYLVLLLVAVDLLRFSVKFIPFSPAVLDFPKTPVLEFLQSQPGYYRFDKERAELLPPNSWISYKLMSPSGYDPLYSKQYAEFYSVYNGGKPGSSFSRYAELDKYDQPFLSLAGVKYLLILDRGQMRYYDEKLADKTDDPSKYQFKKIGKDGQVLMLENQKVLPRVKLYSRADLQPNYRDALLKLSSGYDFYQRIMVNKPVNLDELAGNLSAEIVDYKTNQVDVAVQSGGKAVLMLTDAYYPGWRAEVSGQPSEVLVADGVYRAVAVPPGRSTVKFIYDPLSFKIGVILSLISLGTVILLLGLFLKKR